LRCALFLSPLNHTPRNNLAAIVSPVYRRLYIEGSRWIAPGSANNVLKAGDVVRQAAGQTKQKNGNVIK